MVIRKSRDSLHCLAWCCCSPPAEIPSKNPRRHQLVHQRSRVAARCVRSSQSDLTSEEATKEFAENPKNKDFGDITSGMTLAPEFKIRVGSQAVYEELYSKLIGKPGVEQVGYGRVR
ncbi:hypothetical protein [Antrihabitans cavernicola]|uniref:Uncharacterized protein n=1 Tax=Antrihabitans cavernicola TaxID=2495913 RepID=A0A5A7SI82_9NOCA|nr:hypothetical protein [Spelaeibacter cavernicola]KAA0024437.1 hypothetical protein FOY51_00240 [Spelaeibacter cavernicola]